MISFLKLPRACPACGISNKLRARHLGVLDSNDPEFFRAPFPLMQCRKCGTIFLSPAPSEKELNQSYLGKKQFESPDYSGERLGLIHDFYRGCFERLREGISATPLKVLEVGAGKSWISYAAKSACSDNITVAQDITPEAAGSCAWVDHYLVGELELVLDRIRALGPFHIISLTHVIEHLLDPVAALKTLRELLERNGRIFLTAPHRPVGWSKSSSLDQWSRWSYNHVPQHLQYFHRKSFEIVATRSTLSLEKFDASSEDGQAFEAWLRHPPLSDRRGSVSRSLFPQGHGPHT